MKVHFYIVGDLGYLVLRYTICSSIYKVRKEKRSGPLNRTLFTEFKGARELKIKESEMGSLHNGLTAATRCHLVESNSDVLTDD